MALHNCPDCGREISDRAATCLHCGAPNPPRTARGSATWKIALTVLAVAVLAGAGIALRVGGFSADYHIAYCRDLVRALANHPDQLEWHHMAAGIENGGKQVRIEYSAANAFGMKTRGDAVCRFTVDETGKAAQRPSYARVGDRVLTEQDMQRFEILWEYGEFYE